MNDASFSSSFTAFTAKCSKISRSLHCDVELESTLDPNGKIKCDALWDTGAMLTLIRPEVTRKLNLSCISKVLLSTPTGSDVPSNIYLVNLYLPNGVVVTKIKVAEGIPSGCDMLIGMDIINLGDFAVSNYNGHTMFTFRMPSIEEIDFCGHVQNTVIRSMPKIGRNDLCPCGSGKKYKYCHGR